MLETLPGLANALRARGRTVCSLEVVGDPIDERLHAYLRGCSTAGEPNPPLVCRLGPGDYFLGGEHVTISIAADSSLFVQSAFGGQRLPLRDYVSRQARYVPVPSAGRTSLSCMGTGLAPRP